MINKSSILLTLILCVTKLFGQEITSSADLLKLDTYESKRNYYYQFHDDIDALNAVRRMSTNEQRPEHRLELLLFYLRLQCKFDISIGKTEAFEALRLAKGLDKQLQTAMAYEHLFIANMVNINKSDSSLYFADMAMDIAKQMNDHVLEAYLYGDKYTLYSLKGDNSQAVSNYIKSVELAEKYAGPIIKNEIYLEMVGITLNFEQTSLTQKLLNHVEFEHLNVQRQLDYYIYKAQMYAHKNKIDSVDIIYDNYINNLNSENAYFHLGKYMMQKNRLDSALTLFHKAISIKAPEESYFEKIYYEIADIYKSKNIFDSTEYYLNLCLKDAIRLKEEHSKARAHLALAKLYLENNDDQLARAHAKSGYTIAHKGDLSQWIVPLTQLLASLSRNDGDYKQAIKYLDESVIHNNKINQQNTQLLLKNAEISRDLKIWSDTLDREQKNAKDTKMTFFFVMLFLIIVAAWFYYLYRSIRHLNTILINRNKEAVATLNQLEETQIKLIQSEKLAAVGTLTAGVAHEINNPLNYINGTSIILESFFENKLHNYKEELKPYLIALRQGVGRVTQIVKGLNSFNMTSERYDDACEVASIIDNTLAMAVHEVSDDIVIKKEYDFLGSIKGNTGKLHQVFLNIILNGIDAIQEQGELIINTKQDNDAIVIKITDTGCGMDTDTISKISDPFYSNKKTGNGVGLGMYISYGIIRDHKGSLEYQSVIGEGTTAIVRLPLYQ